MVTTGGGGVIGVEDNGHVCGTIRNYNTHVPGKTRVGTFSDESSSRVVVYVNTFACRRASLQTVAYLGFANDGLQVRRGLQIIGVGAAHERLDGCLADGPAEEQLDHRTFRHRSDAG